MRIREMNKVHVGFTNKKLILALFGTGFYDWRHAGLISNFNIYVSSKGTPPVARVGFNDEHVMPVRACH